MKNDITFIFFFSENKSFTLPSSSSPNIYNFAIDISTSTTMNYQIESVSPKILLFFFSPFLISYPHKPHIIHFLSKFIKKLKILIINSVRFISSCCGEVLGDQRNHASHLTNSRFEIANYILFFRSVLRRRLLQKWSMHRLVLQLTFCVFLIEDFTKSLLTFLCKQKNSKFPEKTSKHVSSKLKKSSRINMFLLNLAEVGQKFDFLQKTSKEVFLEKTFT